MRLLLLAVCVLGLGVSPATAQTRPRLRFVTACTGTPMTTGDTWQTLVTAGSAGDTFCIQPGTHYQQSVTPKNNQTFIALPGVIMSGARVLTGWTSDTGRWYIGGQTQAGAAVGTCLSGYPRCDLPEDVYRDNVVLIPVATLGDGVSGKFFFDYAADRIYVWDDPNGHTMETTLTTVAFSGSATGVTIRGLTIEKYANAAQTGAIQGGASWVVAGNEVRWNHGGGIGMGATRTVSGNNVHHNGQMGILGSGNGSTVTNNTIAYNNTLGFDPYWEAGGTKFTFTNGLTVAGNFVHHNYGNGLWTDIDNINIIFEDNLVEDNADAGIHHEISYAAVIRNNILNRNGTRWTTPTFWVDGACILVADSMDVEVYGNTCTGNAQGLFAIDLNRGSGGLGVWNLERVHFHDNTVSSVTGAAGTGRTGVGALDSGYKTADITWVHDTYTLGANLRYFAWDGGEKTEAEWVAYGQDVTGTFNR